ncbi:hypothetical protein PCASD_05943 [Puccinia coronata f. sp. avenae]|uniref:Cullin family profile domain-containing protein n=1 Tax=Puccinia coronata f. sp. avenae TaxID=200324 RepID=A0A2N5V679_9BASI|nr:hypothetical protein PCASD_05943 [Puccinia coronata f. sp. avenae]
MKRTNPESRPSFGQQTHADEHERTQESSQHSLQTFRSSAAALKRNRIEPAEEAHTLAPSHFNPVRTELPTLVVLGLTNQENPSSASAAPQINSILQISRISIKNLKKKQLPSDTAKDVLYQDALASIRQAIQDILQLPPKATDASLTTLSAACQALVFAGSTWIQRLYSQLKTQLEDKTIQIRSNLLQGVPNQPIVDSLLSSDSVDMMAAIGLFDQSRCQSWLEETHAIWLEWYNQLRLVRSMLIHLDRFILAQNQDMLPIWELGLDLFRKNVVGRPWNPISLSLSVAICQQITVHRSGQTIPLGLLESLARLIYTAFGTTGFTSLISTSLEQTTQSFYAQEGKRLIDDIESNVLSVGGPSGYLSHINTRLQSEVDLITRIFTTPDRALNAQLLKAVLRLIESNLILVHLDVLLTRGLVHLLESFPDPTSADSLRMLYTLLTRLGDQPTQQLQRGFSQWIKAAGAPIVQKPTTGGEEEEAKQDAGMIQRLIDFKTTLDRIVVDCFSRDREMFYAIKESFETFINQRHNKPAELLAKFLDLKMRTASRSMNESEIETCLEHILILFRYSQAKDIFEEFYKRDLAKRLLLGKTSSIDLERHMVMKLKKECGPGFTAKLEVMFRDLETSIDLNSAYQTTHGHSTQGDGLDLTVCILTSGSWPISHLNEPKAILPSRLHSHLTQFETFYTTKHLGRRLSWTHSLGQVVLAASFPVGPRAASKQSNRKEFTVSTIQALVLLLFNDDLDDQSIDFDSVVERTGIDEKTAARTLQSLACGKVRVLVKSPKSKEVAKTDRFVFNSNFKDEHFKIKINQIQSKETVEERSSTRDKVVTERSTLIQLSIVRIMKARKRAKFNALVFEVVEYLKNRFQVDVKDVKVAIENLITRDYLERVGMDEFQYLA